MNELLNNYPTDILAMECVDEITADDYRDILIPEINRRLENHDAVRVLCVIGPRFKGYSPGAAWEDFSFGISHWNQFERLAVVTDVAWIRNVMRLFTPIFHPMRCFAYSDMDEARQWILANDKPGSEQP